MSTWNKDRPDGNEKWNVADGRIRDNFAFLEAALQEVSTFAINPADPTDRMVGKFKNGNLVDRPVMSLASQTGVVYFAQDTVELYVCSNGATNTWTQIHRFGEALTFTAALTAQNGLQITGGTLLAGVITAIGLISANAGLTLAAGQLLTVPSGQNWLTNGTTAFNPHSHSARHRPGSVDGVWDANADFLPFSLQRIVESSALLHGAAVFNGGGSYAAQAFGAAGDAKCSLTVNTTGRPTTSRGLLIGEFTTRRASSGAPDLNDEWVQMALLRDAIGNRLGAIVWRWFEDTVPSSNGYQTHTAVRYVTGLSAAAHEFAMHLHTEEGVANSVEAVSVQMLYLDLGTE